MKLLRSPGSPSGMRRRRPERVLLDLVKTSSAVAAGMLPTRWTPPWTVLMDSEDMANTQTRNVCEAGDDRFMFDLVPFPRKRGRAKSWRSARASASYLVISHVSQHVIRVERVVLIDTGSCRACMAPHRTIDSLACGGTQGRTAMPRLRSCLSRKRQTSAGAGDKTPADPASSQSYRKATWLAPPGRRRKQTTTLNLVSASLPSFLYSDRQNTLLQSPLPSPFNYRARRDRAFGPVPASVRPAIHVSVLFFFRVRRLMLLACTTRFLPPATHATQP